MNASRSLGAFRCLDGEGGVCGECEDCIRDAPCPSCGATPDGATTPGCPVCEGVIEA